MIMRSRWWPEHMRWTLRVTGQDCAEASSSVRKTGVESRKRNGYILICN